MERVLDDLIFNNYLKVVENPKNISWDALVPVELFAQFVLSFLI